MTRPVVLTPQHAVPEYKPDKKIEVALVLSGGGAKGFAHLGAIEVLEHHGVPIDLIVGTSAGSIVGSIYADTGNCKDLYNKLMWLDKWDLIDFSIDNTFRSIYEPIAPATGFALENYLSKHLNNQNIEDLKVPFVAVTTDLIRQQPYIITSGPIAPAVHASSALPPLISPVFGYGTILVDGSVTMPVPVEVAKRYNPKVIIAVDITTSDREVPIYNIWDVANRSFYVMYYTFARSQSRQADIDIHPDLNDFGLFDDSRRDELYAFGKIETENSIPKLLELLKKKGIQLNRGKKNGSKGGADT